jgi:predicted RNA-binding protein
MQVYVNGELREIKIASISTLLDVVTKVEVTLPPGYIMTEVILNEKILESNWYHNASKIYLLDEDKLHLRVEESSMIARQVLQNSKEQFKMLLKEIEEIADAFRLQDDTKANTKFIQGIENLQWFLKILEDATVLIGKPFDTIVDNDTSFTKYVNDLSKQLDRVISIQQQKDWIMLADILEYEVIPALEKIGRLYTILNI